MKRKVLFLILGAVCASACATGLSACELFQKSSSDVTADGIKFELTNDNTYRATGFVNAEDTRETLEIPDKVGGVAVTEISSLAFEGCTSLKNVSVPASVSDIDVGAFKGCTAVESMKLPFVGGKPNGWALGYNFSDDANAPNAEVVPSTLKSVELLCETDLNGGDFKDCSSLETVVLPDTLTYVGRFVFENCTSLTNVVIPDSVTHIENAFVGCTSLESLTLPHIGEFRDPSEATGTPRTNFGFHFNGTSANNDIPESLKTVIVTVATEIDAGAFKNCTGIENIELPESLTQLGASAFYGCTSLKSVNIPNQLTEIANNTFTECENLEITIPENVTTIKTEAFKSCTNLVVTLSEGLQAIGNNAFEGCANLEISIPSSVKSVASGAFTGCTKAVITENGMSYVDKWLISADCETAEIKDGTVGVASLAFTSSLKKIIIPESVLNFSAFAFTKTGAGTIVINYNGSIESWCNINFGNSEANPLFRGYDIKILLNGEYVTALTIYDGYADTLEIPESVDMINDYAFSLYSNVKAVYIPAQVTQIGSNAFFNCSDLKDIIFGGTREEWENVEKGVDWDAYVGRGEYTLHCADDEE